MSSGLEGCSSTEGDTWQWRALLVLLTRHHPTDWDTRRRRGPRSLSSLSVAQRLPVYKLLLASAPKKTYTNNALSLRPLKWVTVNASRTARLRGPSLVVRSAEL